MSLRFGVTLSVYITSWIRETLAWNGIIIGYLALDRVEISYIAGWPVWFEDICLG